MGKPIHVVPQGDKWAVKREGRETPISTHGKQGNAIDLAAQVARQEKTDVVIHGRDGKIRDRDSYGPDPFPPRDRKH